MKKSDSKKRAADTKILKRLAQGFAAIAWCDDKILDPSEAATLLDINEESVVLLCGTGFLRGCEDGGVLGVPLAEITRFHEEYGGWWFTARARKQLERLRRRVEVESPITRSLLKLSSDRRARLALSPLKIAK